MSDAPCDNSNSSYTFRAPEGTNKKKSAELEAFHAAVYLELSSGDDPFGQIASGKGPFDSVRCALPNMSIEGAKELARMINEEHKAKARTETYTAGDPVSVPSRILSESAGDAATSAEILSILAKDPEADIRIKVAANDNADDETLSKLAKDEDSDVRGEIAVNPYTPANILSELANDKESVIRSNVAGNPDTPPNILSELAKDKESTVRYDVAGNLNAPPDLLSQLANDEDWQVREEVVRNRNTPPNILSQLANDKMHFVREEAAKNLNTPTDDLERLAKDKDPNVRKAAGVNLLFREVERFERQTSQQKAF